MDQAHALSLAVFMLVGAACEGGVPPPEVTLDGGTLDAGAPDAGRDTRALPYAQAVVRFVPGLGAGFGQDRMPQVVLGPPDGRGTTAGSLDVLSLGVGGEIVLDLGPVRDGEGPDLVVFENAFWANGDPEGVYAELSEVAVSTDAVSWRTFACDATRDGRTSWPGCAGWSPALLYDAFEVVPLSLERTGGDGFDLAEVGLAQARYVRIRDRGSDGLGPTAGFDLDAVGVIYPDAE